MKRFRINLPMILALCAFFAFIGCTGDFSGVDKKADVGGEKQVRLLYSSNGNGEFEKCG